MALSQCITPENMSHNRISYLLARTLTVSASACAQSWTQPVCCMGCSRLRFSIDFVSERKGYAQNVSVMPTDRLQGKERAECPVKMDKCVGAGSTGDCDCLNSHQEPTEGLAVVNWIQFYCRLQLPAEILPRLEFLPSTPMAEQQCVSFSRE